MIFASIFLSKSFECFANYRFIRDSLSSARKWITWNSQSIYVAELASSFSAIEYFGMATITTNWFAILISTSTGWSPIELFLNQMPLPRDSIVDPDTAPTVQNWIENQIYYKKNLSKELKT